MRVAPVYSEIVVKVKAAVSTTLMSVALLAYLAAPLFAQSPAVQTAPPTVYRDPQGRFSVAVPAGWTVTPAAGTSPDLDELKLSNGPSNATVLANSGAQPRQVAHLIAHRLESQYREFQITSEGPLGVNGHPSDAVNATGTDSKGVNVSIFILSIGADATHFVSVVSICPSDRAEAVRATVKQMAISMLFAGE